MNMNKLMARLKRVYRLMKREQRLRERCTGNRLAASTTAPSSPFRTATVDEMGHTTRPRERTTRSLS